MWVPNSSKGARIVERDCEASWRERNLCRVGALAIGLGVGAAIASMPAVALADTTESSGSAGSSASADGPSAGAESGGSDSGGADPEASEGSLSSETAEATDSEDDAADSDEVDPAGSDEADLAGSDEADPAGSDKEASAVAGYDEESAEVDEGPDLEDASRSDGSADVDSPVVDDAVEDPAAETTGVNRASLLVRSNPTAAAAAATAAPGASQGSAAPTLSAIPIYFRLVLDDIFGGSKPPPSAEPVPVITGLFRQMLREDPTPEELQSYLRVWNLWGINGVVAGLYSSSAFRQEQVNNYYLELLGRNATQSELSWGAFRLRWGTSEAALAASIAGTSEYYKSAAAGGGPAGVQPTANTWVDLLYRTLMGMPANPDVAPIYVQKIQGGLPTSWAAMHFVQQDPFRTVKVQEIYQVIFEREATAEEVAAYLKRWVWDGGVSGIATELLASAANVARIEAGEVQLPDMVAAAQLTQLLLAPYDEQNTGFVNLFNELFGNPTKDNPCTPTSCANPGLYELLTTGGVSRGIPNSAIEVESINANVATLLPTQNEISMRSSLRFPLQDPVSLSTYFQGGVIQPFGNPVMTSEDGAYIVDGHHRWSQIYVINPFTQVSAADLGYVPTPKDSLKQTQIAIAAENGYLEGSTASGDNLYTVDKETFDLRVVEYITTGDKKDEVMAVFTTYLGLEGQTEPEKFTSIQNYLWTNVLRMRSHNPYIPGATSRPYMPQANPLPPILQRMDGPSSLSYTFPVISYLG
ncbi:MAG: hypothetical protein AB7G47_02030 [Mycolicibacterium sp.]|uniref:hypothetical protein n=1 Tax=Mycolicibacterium sp. TaxID=2320850 RepID=UPI003D11802D